MRVKAQQQSNGKIVDRRLSPLSTEAGQLEVVGRRRPDFSASGPHLQHRDRRLDTLAARQAIRRHHGMADGG